MLFHHDRRTTKSAAATPMRPEGYGGIGPSRSLPILGDERASPSSRRLRSGTMALVTRSLQTSTSGCHENNLVSRLIKLV